MSVTGYFEEQKYRYFGENNAVIICLSLSFWQSLQRGETKGETSSIVLDLRPMTRLMYSMQCRL